MIIEVRGHRFDIDLVNNYCREKWMDFLGLVNDLGTMRDESEEILEEAKKLEDKESKKAAVAKIKENNAAETELKKKIIAFREEIIEELLVTNNIEYDKDFWHRRTDVDDHNDFIITALSKDSVKGSKKK